MLYSKRRKNLGGRKKRSNRRSYGSNRLRMRGGKPGDGIVIIFNIDNSDVIKSFIEYLRGSRDNKTRGLLYAISPLNGFMVPVDANHKQFLYAQYANIGNLNEGYLSEHYKGLRNLRRIISDYNIPSFTLRNGISVIDGEYVLTGVETKYLADNSAFEAYAT